MAMNPQFTATPTAFVTSSTQPIPSVGMSDMPVWSPATSLGSTMTTTSPLHESPSGTEHVVGQEYAASKSMTNHQSARTTVSTPTHQSKRFRERDEYEETIDDDEGDTHADHIMDPTRRAPVLVQSISHSTAVCAPDPALSAGKKQRLQRYQPPRAVPLSLVSVMGSLVVGTASEASTMTSVGMRRQLSGSQLDQFLSGREKDDDTVMDEDDLDFGIDIVRRMSF